jgi:hypothetical protein
MGRKSREHRERRERRFRSESKKPSDASTRSDRAEQLESELKRLADGDAIFWTSGDCPAEVRVSNLEDILAFESVGSGPVSRRGCRNTASICCRPRNSTRPKALKR